MFCEQCGAQLQDGIQFCEQCGARVSGEQNEMPPIQQGSVPFTPQPMPAMNPGFQGQYNAGQINSALGKNSKLVPVIIAVAGVLVLGLAGFGVYKNIDKIKALIGKKEEIAESPKEDISGIKPDIEEMLPQDDGSIKEDKFVNGSDDEKKEDTTDNEEIEEVKPAEDTKNEEEPEEESKEEPKEEPEKDLTVKDENRPDIGDVWDYDTSERPVWSDFEWVLSDEMTKGISNGKDMFSDSAYRLTDYDDIVGGWKGYLCYDPYNTYPDNPWGGPVVFLVHAEISGDEDSPDIYFEWLRYRNTSDGDEGDLSTKAVFECENRGNVIDGKLENGWRIKLEHFCWMDGQEYATGRMRAADGGACILALFRP